MNKSIDEIIKNKKVILMDFDGTITDTEPLNYLTWVKCLEPYGIQFTKEQFKQIVGRPISSIADYFQEQYPDSFDRDEFLSKVSDYVRIFMDIEKQVYVPMFDYVKDILAYKDKQKIVVSNQTRPLIDNMLSKWGVQGEFTRIISCMDEKLNKLDIYDKCQEYFGVPATDCVLCEDMQVYLDAGKAHGMATIGIQHSYNTVKNADIIITPNGSQIAQTEPEK